MAYSVTQNTVYLTTASIIQKAISFVYFILVARAIGVESAGQYFFALAFTSVFTVVADFGMGPVITRELARALENSAKYINSLISAKILFGLFAYALVVIFANLLNYSNDLKLLIYIAGITMFLDNLQTVFFSTFRAHKNLKIEAVGVILSQFLTLCFGLIVLTLKAPVYYLIVAYALSSFIIVCYAFVMLRIKLGIVIKPVLNLAIVKQFLNYSWVFALAAILSRLYAYTDSILISKFLPSAHMGWWSVPYKITYAFQFIPVAVATSVYPVLSSNFLDVNKMRETFMKAWRYLFIIVFPLVFGVMVVAKQFIGKLYGVDYLPSVVILQILMVSLIFGFLSFVSGAVLNASNRQNYQTLLMGLALIINVVFNLILLPRYGLVGAALSALIGNFVLTVAGYLLCSRILALSFSEVMVLVARYCIPAILMSFIVGWLLSIVGLWISIILGILVYVISVIFSKGISFGEIKEFYQHFKRQTS